jgi:WD40 repeat protein
MSRQLRIFISSPSDVEPERRRAALVIDKLTKDYARFFDVRFILWETEPMLASGNFQDHIIPPSECDIVVLMLWSRLGSPLPEKTALRRYCGIDGRTPVTGTEWEYEDALAAQRKNGVPDIVAYRKAVDPKVPLRDLAAKAAAENQWLMLETFWQNSFIGPKVAFREFEDLNGFEKHVERDLRQLIERHTRTLQAADYQDDDKHRPTVVWLKGSPFRGLESYRFEHAPIFFGRSEATKTAVEQLVENSEAGRPFLLILGASGAGKSSLAQAGVLAGVSVRGVVPGVALWRRAVMRPGGHPDGPYMALAEALTAEAGLPELVSAGQTAADLARHLSAAAQDPAYPIISALHAREAVARAHGDILPHEEARLALLVDQLEELFTVVSPEQRANFVACLDGLMCSGRVFVIATMRSDYWHRAADSPRLMALAEGRGRLDLLPATRAEIAEMIRRPAETAGLSFQVDPRTEIRLDAALADEAAQEPGALPLLSFLLDALYVRDIQNPPETLPHSDATTQSQVEKTEAASVSAAVAGKATSLNRTELTYDSVRALGGLKGAIAQRAEDVFATLSPETQAALPKLLRALVTVSRSGAEPTAREAPMSRFAEHSPERKIADTLLAPDRRLLVAQGDGEGARVRVAHEALINHWERAKRQIAQDRDDLRTRTAIEEAEAEWRAADGADKRGYLLRDPQFANAVDLAGRWGDELSPELRTFIALSESAVKAAARRRMAVAAVIMFCLGALAIASGWALYVAETQRGEALMAQSRFLARYARTSTISGDATLGMLLALAALPQDLTKPDRPFAEDAGYALEESFANRRESYTLRHADVVNAAAFSRDGARVVTASNDKTAKVWDTDSGKLVVTFSGHEREVHTAVFSRDGAHVLTASADKTAKLWDATTGKLLAILAGHERDVRTAAFSPDDNRIVTASEDGSARIWDGHSDAQIAVLSGGDKSLESAAFSLDGTRVVTVSTEGLGRIWDVATARQIAVLRGHNGRITSAVFSPDGDRVVTSSFDRTARVWNAKTGAEILSLTGHEGLVNSAAFSPDGTRVVTASNDQTARLWDVGGGPAVGGSGRPIAVLRHDKDVILAVFSADGTRIITASADKTAHIWDVMTGAEMATLRGHEKDVVFAAFSRDGRQAVTTSADNTGRLWNVEIGAAGPVLSGHTAAVSSAAFSRDGARVVTSSFDRTARVWDATTGKELARLPENDGAVVAAVFSPDGNRVLTASWNGAGRLWDARTGAQIRALRGQQDMVTTAEFSLDGTRIVTSSYDRTATVWDAASGASIAVLKHNNRVNSASFSPDGMRVVTASDDSTAVVWDAADGKAIAVLRGHVDAVKTAYFSPDGARVVTASADRTARLWDAKSGAQIAVMEGHTDLVDDAKFSRDGTRVVSASWDKTARLWDGRTGARIATLEGHDAQVVEAEFSADGLRVLTASWDATARLWDARTGAPGAVLRGHTRPLTSATFSADGTRIVTTSEDKTARLWNTPPRCTDLMNAARGAAPRQLTDQQRNAYFLIDRPAGLSSAIYGAIRPLLSLVLREPGHKC